MIQTPYVIHGSEDSIDIDAFFILEHDFLVSQSQQQLKELCEKLSSEYGFNGNLIAVKNGVVSFCYKGTIDEVNNGMLYTYHLHNQKHQLPVIRRVERDLNIKVIRCIRGILSMYSRSDFRPEIKEALRSDTLRLKLNVLKKIDFNDVFTTNFSTKGDIKDILKFFSFQLIQTCALLEGEEIFTKAQVTNYDEDLAILIHRGHYYCKENIEIPLMTLNHYKNWLIKFTTISCDLDAQFMQTQFGKLSIKEEKYVD